MDKPISTHTKTQMMDAAGDSDVFEAEKILRERTRKVNFCFCTSYGRLYAKLVTLSVNK
jgi:hypothetical protein